MSQAIETNPGEITINKKVQADIETVWQAFANPEQISQWYGPQDFTCTVLKMEFKKGGDWELILHAPDGSDFTNSNRFSEITEQKTIIYEHQSAPFFRAEITFNDLNGKTAINWKMTFYDLAEFEKAKQQNNVLEGLKQNLDKLEVYLMNSED